MSENILFNLKILLKYLNLVRWYRDIPSVYIKIALLIHIMDNKQDDSLLSLTPPPPPHISLFSPTLVWTIFKVIPHL